MRVLIVESHPDRGKLWKNHLEFCGMDVDLVAGQQSAILRLQNHAPDVIVLNLMLDEGSALAVADYASFRVPEVRVIFVTNTTFFSDGSIFSFSHNACAFVQSATPPDDLAAMVEHFAGT